MTCGAIFPSRVDRLALSPIQNPTVSAYPLENLKDLVRTSKVTRWTDQGDVAFGGVFDAPMLLQAFALIGHNVPAGTGYFRLVLFSGTGNDPTANAGEIVFDSANMLYWPDGAAPNPRYRPIRPLILPSAVAARSLWFFSRTPGMTLQMEAFEAGMFWSWPGVSPGRSLGIGQRENEIQLAGGAAYRTEQPRPRTVSGQVDLMAMSITSTSGMDFQKTLGIQRPFVWSEVFEQPAAWARKVMLVRNRDLSPLAGALYRHDRFPVNLIEHAR